MSTTVEQHVETHLKVIEAATGPLEKIATAADHTAKSLEHVKHAAGEAGEHAGGIFGKLFHTLQEVAGISAVVGGALELHAAVEQTEKYMKNIKEIHELTGATAGEADFLLSTARKQGVEYETMQRTMFQLSRRGSMLEQTMAAAANRVPGMEAKFKRLGVVMNKGPIVAMTTMAAAVKKGKVDSGDLMAQFRIPPGQVNDFKEFLEKLDPKKLAQAKAGKGPYISDEDLESFVKLEKAHHRITDAWNRIRVMIAKNLLPVAARFAEDFAGRLEGALPVVERIVKVIADHMDQIVLAAKAYAMYMGGKKVLGFVGGKLPGAISFAKTFAEAGAKMFPFLGRAAMKAGASAGRFAATSGIMQTLGLSTPAVAGGLAQVAGAMTVLLPIILAVAAVAALVALGFRAVEKNVGGVGDRIRDVWDRIKDRFEIIGETFTGIIDKISALFGGGKSGGLSGILDKIGYLAATVFALLLEELDRWMLVLQVITGMLSDGVTAMTTFYRSIFDAFTKYFADPLMGVIIALGKMVGFAMTGQFGAAKKAFEDLKTSSSALLDGFSKTQLKVPDFGMKSIADSFKRNMFKATSEMAQRDAYRRMQRATEAAERKTPEERDQKVFDFRGSRFDITQNFAEGFDPDRIAVVFGNDLANLGEMKSQSGFAPLFGAH